LTKRPDSPAAVAEALAPLLGERDAHGDFIFPLPASARIDTLLLGCTHYPLLRPLLQEVAGDLVAIVDSASATASALAELLSVNGLEAPAKGASEARAPERNGSTGGSAVHVQYTTGDVDTFRALASRLFGSEFPDVQPVELRAAAS
jgi:glutamate racemase